MSFTDYEIRNAIHALQMSPKTANRIIYYMIDVQNAAKLNQETELDVKIIELWKQKGRIKAITYTREKKGWGLMKTKDYVFNLATKLGLYQQP